MKGDRVEIVIDAGEEARTYEVVATKAGRPAAVIWVRAPCLAGRAQCLMLP